MNVAARTMIVIALTLVLGVPGVVAAAADHTSPTSVAVRVTVNPRVILSVESGSATISANTDWRLSYRDSDGALATLSGGPTPAETVQLPADASEITILAE